MDKYNQRWVRLFGKKFANDDHFGITINQTAYFSCNDYEVSERWHRHEDQHKRQFARLGVVKFLYLYRWYLIRYGYEHNPLEIEARAAETIQVAGVRG